MAAAEAVARLWVGTTFLVLAVVALGAVIVSAMVARRYVARFASAVCLAITLAVITSILVGVFGTFELYAYLGKDLFDATLGRYPSPSNAGLTLLKKVVLAGNIVGTVAASFLVVAIAAVVLRFAQPVIPLPAEIAGAPVAASARALGEAIRDLKYLLLAAAGLLVAAIWHMKAWREWPLAFFGTGDAPLRKAFEEVINATLTYDSVYFALILAAMFVPVSWWLQNQGRELASLEPAAGSDNESRERWLVSNGVSLQFGEQAQRLVAIVAPFLGVPAVELIKKILTATSG